MKSEYVRLTNAERMFGNKNLLHAQLEFLSSLRNFENYKNLRSKEFILKISMKNRIEEAYSLITKLESFLPKSSFKISSGEEKKRKEKVSPSLIDEMEAIKRKIERLQFEM